MMMRTVWIQHRVCQTPARIRSCLTQHIFLGGQVRFARIAPSLRRRTSEPEHDNALTSPSAPSKTNTSSREQQINSINPPIPRSNRTFQKATLRDIHHASRIVKLTDQEIEQIVRERYVGKSVLEGRILNRVTELKLGIMDMHNVGIPSYAIRNLIKSFPVSSLTSEQLQIIDSIVRGSDVVIKHETGSGKTLSILLALFHHLNQSTNTNTRMLKEQQPKKQVLILLPNQDLTMQIHGWLKRLLAHLSEKEVLRTLQCLVPREDIEDQMTLLLSQGPPKIMVATSTRLLEILESEPSLYNLHQTDLLVMDEFDSNVRPVKKNASIRQSYLRVQHPTPGEILLGKLFGERPDKLKRPQVVISSASMTTAVKQDALDRKWIRKNHIYLDFLATHTDIQSGNLPKSVHHGAVIVPSSVKSLSLKEVVAKMMDIHEWTERAVSLEPPSLNAMLSVFVETFTQRKNDTSEQSIMNGDQNASLLFIPDSASITKTMEFLVSRGIVCQRLGDTHGNLSQTTKDLVEEPLQESNSHETESQHNTIPPRLLVTTYHSSPGLDLLHHPTLHTLSQHLSTVYILGLPKHKLQYVHLSGRVGRMGLDGRRGGKVVSILEERDVNRWWRFVKQCGVVGNVRRVLMKTEVDRVDNGDDRNR